jgi:membrane-bound lytic murein transglycosylase D
MKLPLSVLALFLGASSVMAAEFPVNSIIPQPLVQVASSTSGNEGTFRQERVSRKGITTLTEKKLSTALELPDNDPMVAGNSADVFDEFELKIPDHDLPPSDIPLTLNSKVEYFINFFQVSGRNWFAKWLSRSERYLPMMQEVLKKNGLPVDLVYLAMIESGFSTHAQSHASAVGPWQFISGTGKRYSLRIDQWIDERRDPLKSTVAAALYLKDLYSIFNKDWYLAAAGYNAGENKILRAIGMYNSSDFWQLTEGSYLKRETKDYVPKLLAAAIIAKEPAKYGFADVAYLPPLEFDTVSIPSRTDLDLVARILNVPVNTIRELNPALRTWCTPPDYPGYELKLPKGTGPLFMSHYGKIPPEERYLVRTSYAQHKVRRGETLETIARRYGTSSAELATLNDLQGRRLLRGRTLRVPVSVEGVDTSKALVPTPSKQGADKVVAKYYTIKRGDTLTSIARRFNISSQTIVSWNNLKHKATLQPGKKIIVAMLSDANERGLSRNEDKG